MIIETIARSDEKISLDQQRQRHYYQVTMPQASLMALCLNFFKYYIITWLYSSLHWMSYENNSRAFGENVHSKDFKENGASSFME